jgi:hypothetical protein
MNGVRSKIRALTGQRYISNALATVVERLNPVLRGWGNYYRDGNSDRKFAQIDSYVHDASRSSPPPNTNDRVVPPPRRPHPDRIRTLREHECLAIKGVGEPCAGEPHARFDAAVGGVADQSAKPARLAEAPRDPVTSPSHRTRPLRARSDHHP